MTGHDTAHDDLMATWLRGWAAARRLDPPRVEGGGWCVEVGWPDQRRRHVFPRLCDELRERGRSIDEPWVFLKVAAPRDALREILPARWHVQPPSFVMRFDGAPPAAGELPTGHALAIEAPGGVAHARVHAPDGSVAAEGRLVVVDDSAIFDRIGTAPEHRRRGLGRAVMTALHAFAHDHGARRGLLAATEAGHALYTTLGWRVHSPYASAVIPGETAPTA